MTDTKITDKTLKNIKKRNDSCIQIKGAKVHNLKNIDVQLTRNKFVVITGVSGSGKSSLAFDTLYAEGQRRYVESLSSYARQFLGKINKPEVEYIKGIPPAIAIEQKVNTRNPRSTVGTSTEIYDYIKLLFARVGKTFSPVSNKEVRRHHVSDVVDFIIEHAPETKALILAPIILKEGAQCSSTLELLLQQGFTRIEVNHEIKKISDVLKNTDGDCEGKLLSALKNKELNLVIDRVVASNSDENISRLADSVQTAFYEGFGDCYIRIFNTKDGTIHPFSNRFELDGIQFDEPDVHMFSFNNPVGACPTCEGFGKIMGIDEDLVIPNKSKSIYEDAVACWKGEKMSKWKMQLIMNADKFNFPVHKPYYELSQKLKDTLWNGNKYFEGIWKFFKMLESESYKIQYRVMLSRYRGKTICPDCKGTRLKKEASYVKVGDKSVHDLVLMPVEKLNDFFLNLKFDDHDIKVSKRILIEIKSRIGFLCDVGLGYLTLNRLSSTLSGGESQRINLATSLGSSLVGSLYILDEPSIGLHSRDTERLIKVLYNLKHLGNTVLVVEHDEEIIRAADEIIDIGPFAGRLGGEVVFQGSIPKLLDDEKSLTTNYLTGSKKIEVPQKRRAWKNSLKIFNARENNLKHFDVEIPLGVFTVVTGVSGSGKSSLIRDVLYSALQKHFNGYCEKLGKHDMLTGDIKVLHGVEFVDQNPIGKSSRSNPVTYIKAYDEIRKLFSQQQASVINNFKPAHFSFNVDGGRCDECQGDGVIKVEMQFMADVYLLCESCKGKRFKDDVLDVKYHEKSIYDILDMSVNEAIDFFTKHASKTLEKKLVEKIKPLQDVGLGYVKLGQASSTLSGGESQRVKLASFLGKDHDNKPTLFIFDEPTTGLHFHDIKKLLDAFTSLIEKGHSILIIEHNMDVIKSADWLIDLGPEGGENGGHLVGCGTPEEITNMKNSFTGKYLKDKLLV